MKQLFRRRAPFPLFTLIALVVYNAILGFQILRDHGAIIEAAGLRADNIAHVLAGEITNYLTFVDATLETMDFLAAILPPLSDDDGSVAMLRSLIVAKAQRLSMLRGFLIIGPDGYLVMDERGRPPEPLDLSDRNYFKTHIKPHADGVFVGEPVIGRTSGKWFLSVSRRWSNTDGTFNGVIAAIVEPVFLGQSLAAADLGQRGVAALLATSGTIIARSSGHADMIGRNAGQDEGLGYTGGYSGPAGAEKPADGTGEYEPIKIVAAIPVGGFPAKVVVALDREEVLIPWHASLPYYGLAMLLPSAAAIAASLLVRRQQGALAASEASLRVKVTELKDSRELLRGSVAELEASRLKLEEQNAALATLAESRADAQAEAEAANSAKSLFLANVSHELRTPLNAIIGFAELIHQSKLGPTCDPNDMDFAENILSSGLHLLDLINKILDFSMIEAKEGSLKMEFLPVKGIAHSCVGKVQQRAIDAGIIIENRIENRIDRLAEPFVVKADQRALTQVLINLLTNAIKFTPSGGTITLDAAKARGNLQVTVTDTGIGIRRENLMKVGQPFEQANDQLSDKPSGTGLGLALSRRLVELHGGTLTIESEVGIGTRVTFTLPLEPEGKLALSQPVQS